MKKLEGWHKGLILGAFLATISILDTFISLQPLQLILIIGGDFIFRLVYSLINSSSFDPYSIIRPFTFIVFWTLMGFLVFHKTKLYRIIGYILIAINLLPLFYWLLLGLSLLITGGSYT